MVAPFRTSHREKISKLLFNKYLSSLLQDSASNFKLSYPALFRSCKVQVGKLSSQSDCIG